MKLTAQPVTDTLGLGRSAGSREHGDTLSLVPFFGKG